MFPKVTIIRCLLIEKKRGLLNKKNPPDFQKTRTCYLGTTYLQHQKRQKPLQKKTHRKGMAPKKNNQGFYLKPGSKHRFGVSSYASHTSL